MAIEFTDTATVLISEAYGALGKLIRGGQYAYSLIAFLSEGRQVHYGSNSQVLLNALIRRKLNKGSKGTSGKMQIKIAAK